MAGKQTISFDRREYCTEKNSRVQSLLTIIYTFFSLFVVFKYNL